MPAEMNVMNDSNEKHIVVVGQGAAGLSAALAAAEVRRPRTFPPPSR
jgi:succinate dehydrogenase/fumarate reductase flavoprotein subunit